MKKIIILSFLSLVCILPLSAQKWSFGAKAGYNLMTGPTDWEVDRENGFQVGALAEYRFSPTFGLQAELLYSTQKYEGHIRAYALQDGNSIGPLPNYTYSENLGYLTIPVVARIYLIKDLAVEIGPQIGFLTHAKHKGGGESHSIKDNVNSVDFCLVGGLSYTLLSHIDIFARYQHGMQDVFKEYSDRKNQMLQFGLGYRF